MTIRISTRSLSFTLGLLAAVLVGLILLGRAYTPNPPRIYTRADWQLDQMRLVYRSELASLRRDAEALVVVVNAPVADPLRAQLLAGEVANRHADGLPTLATTRTALISAAQTVSDWAVGALEKQSAIDAAQAAIAAIQRSEEEYVSGQ